MSYVALLLAGFGLGVVLLGAYVWGGVHGYRQGYHDGLNDTNNRFGVAERFNRALRN